MFLICCLPQWCHTDTLQKKRHMGADSATQASWMCGSSFQKQYWIIALCRGLSQTHCKIMWLMAPVGETQLVYFVYVAFWTLSLFTSHGVFCRYVGTLAVTHTATISHTATAYCDTLCREMVFSPSLNLCVYCQTWSKTPTPSLKKENAKAQSASKSRTQRAKHPEQMNL